MKKLLTCLCALLLLCGCTNASSSAAPTVTVEPAPASSEDTGDTVDLITPDEGDAKGHEYLQQLKAWSPHEKDLAKTEDDPEFDAFLDRYFKELMEDDYLNMHFTVTDREAMGLEKPELTIGEVTFGYDEENVKEQEEWLEELRSFDFSKLSYRQQYDYDVLEYSELETIASLCFNRYDLLFSDASGIQDNLVTNFTEYVFRSKEDVEDYLVLLQDVERYFKDALEVTKKQAEIGIALQPGGLDGTLDYIDNFTAKVDNNELIANFDYKIDQLSFLSAEEKTAFKEQNAKIVKESVIPAYQNAAEVLESLRGKSILPEEDAGLCGYSKDYAEVTVLLQASTNTDVPVLADQTYNVLISELMAAITCMQDEEAMNEYNALYNDPSSYEIYTKDSAGMLEYLQEALKAEYPDSPYMPFTVSPLDPSVANDSILAYYLTAPVDDIDQNVIRTNPNSLGEDPVSSFETLAHEGFPGHLYQNVYYWRTQPHKFRSAVGFIGYTEGWAMQSEIDGLRYLPLKNENTSGIMRSDTSFGYIMQAYLDVMVNYEGWSLTEVTDFLKDFVSTPEATAQSIYSFCVENPGTIMPYGLGMAQFINLREMTMGEMEEKFDIVEYNEMCLKNGPLPFVLLYDEMMEYSD